MIFLHNFFIYNKIELILLKLRFLQPLVLKYGLKPIIKKSNWRFYEEFLKNEIFKGKHLEPIFERLFYYYNPKMSISRADRRKIFSCRQL